ncbi:hypothetical protein [Cypionkella sp.]|uniref:hypothetical protein n=1 Tax=Cypionkella sp. TaxID=2811411 RepID=UPI002ABA9D4E|nr:hypothetical protein [Cypionkella sp.]MDZ4395000.1 hypothetical protein [Cypionkella sp.]
MPFTSIAEFRATESPTPAEEALIKACQAGDPCVLGDTLPAEGIPTPERHVRADLLRFLILGGTQGCGLHPSGIRLNGAHITEMLDLRFSKAKGSCVLNNCRFDQKLQITQAKFAQLNLAGSYVPGISAQYLRVEGDLILRGLISVGTINVAGSKIGGKFSCIKADIDGLKGDAIGAQGIETGGGMFLTQLKTMGVVAVNGAKIGEQLTFEAAHLEGHGVIALAGQAVEIGASLSLKKLTTKGTINLTGAKIGGQFVCVDTNLDGKAGMALNGQSLRVAEAFIFRKQKTVIGKIDLTAAHVGALRDGTCSESVRFHLEGFTYGRISGMSPLTLATRKDWLARGSRSNDTFHPQPYTQFAKVLREMGHASEARKVLMERDCLLFVESHKTNLTALNAARMGNGSDVGVAWLRYYLLRFWAWFTSRVSGYGHAPQRALFWSLAFMLFGAEWFFLAWQAGVMVPNSAIILTSPDWLAAMAINHDAPSAEWLKLKPSIHYETFYPPSYAFDVFVPFVSLGQEDAWAATTVTWFGWATRWFTFLYQISGWSITALGIAAITGFVQKNQPD